MLKYIKHKISGTEERKRLTGNIISLGVLQGTNYILPLLTLPYLVRVLGPEYFGLLAFATATNMYFILITDYGFNLSATRQISINRESQDKVNDIFSSVMMIKVALMTASLGIMSMLVLSIENYSQYWEVYFLTFGTVIGNLLFPVWLFQGMERMKYITYLSIGAKTFFTICIFLFVKEQTDYLLVPLLTSTGFIVSGIWSLYLVKKKFNIRFVWQTFDKIKLQLSEGWHVFFSSMAISLYTITTTIILGLFTNNTEVGYFASADKIIQAIKGLYQPISQSIYPLLGKKLHENKQAGLLLIQKITSVVGSGMFVISLLLFIFAETIINLLLGDQYKQSVVLLKIMAFLPFIIALSNIFGIQTMLNLGYKQAFGRILLTAALLGVLFSFVLVSEYKGLGIAITLLVVELFVTITMYIFLKLIKGVKC